MQNKTQQRWIGAVTVAAGFIALASLLSIFLAVNYRSEAVADPMLVLGLPGVNANLVKGSMLFDMLGYYLLLLPLIFFLREYLKEDVLLSKLSAACGVAYVLIGGIGAAILAVVWPYIITAYKTAGINEQKLLAANFRFFNMMVYEGLWNLLETIFAAAWWGLTGLLLFRKGFSFIGVFTTVLAAGCLADAASGMFGWTGLHQASLNVYLLLSIVWTIMMGVFLLRKRFGNALLSSTVFNRVPEQNRQRLETQL